MSEQVHPAPLFEYVDIDVEKEDDLFVSAVSAPQVISVHVFLVILLLNLLYICY